MSNENPAQSHLDQWPWLDPGQPLPASVAYWPMGLDRPFWPPILALVTLLWCMAVLLQYADGKTAQAEAIASGVILGAPLTITSVFGLRLWIPPTLARRQRRRGIWREGLYLCRDGLLHIENGEPGFINRSQLRTLRTKADTDQINRQEKREKKQRLKPAICYVDHAGGTRYITLDEKRSEWWSSLAECWEEWRLSGTVSAHQPTGFLTTMRLWLPNILYLQSVYLGVTCLGLALFVVSASLINAEFAFILNMIIGLLMMFGFAVLALRLLTPLRRWIPALPEQLSFEHGGGYAVLLGFCSVAALLLNGGQSAVWWQTAFAQRLADVKVAEAPNYKHRHVMLGLPDAKIETSAFGAYQPVTVGANRQSERRQYHYVMRLHSREFAQRCIYLGIVEPDPLIKTRRRATALEGLVSAQFYRVPLPLGPSLEEGWQGAIRDLDGTEPGCHPMVVEPINDPDKLAIREWRKLTLAFLLMQAVPLGILLGWVMFERRHRWL